jgi:hypothetical protein
MSKYDNFSLCQTDSKNLQIPMRAKDLDPTFQIVRLNVRNVNKYEKYKIKRLADALDHRNRIRYVKTQWQCLKKAKKIYCI